VLGSLRTRGSSGDAVCVGGQKVCTYTDGLADFWRTAADGGRRSVSRFIQRRRPPRSRTGYIQAAQSESQ
jgi:hypothetical protein